MTDLRVIFTAVNKQEHAIVSQCQYLLGIMIMMPVQCMLIKKIPVNFCIVTFTKNQSEFLKCVHVYIHCTSFNMPQN